MPPEGLKSKLATLLDKLAGIPNAPVSKQETADAVTSIVADVNQNEKDWRAKGPRAGRLKAIKSLTTLFGWEDDSEDDSEDDGSITWPKRPTKTPKGTRHRDDGITEMFQAQAKGGRIIPRTFSNAGTTVLGIEDTNVCVTTDLSSLPVPPALHNLFDLTILPLIRSTWPDADFAGMRWEFFPGSAADPRLVEIRLVTALTTLPLWLYIHSGSAYTAIGITADMGAAKTQPRSHDLAMDCLDMLSNTCVDDFIGWFSAHGRY